MLLFYRSEVVIRSEQSFLVHFKRIKKALEAVEAFPIHFCYDNQFSLDLPMPRHFHFIQ